MAPLPFGPHGSILFDGPEDLLATLAALVLYCPDGFSGELRFRVLFERPALRREIRLAGAQVDLFLADEEDGFLLFALHDLRRRLEAGPSVFLRVSREEPDCTLYLAAAAPYHRKLGRWFLVGLLAAVGGLRFAHAGAVGDGGAAALIIGAHGSGKSTLAAAAVIAGLDLLAEGVALVDGAGRLVPFFMDGEPLVRLGGGAWREIQPRLPELEPVPEMYPSQAGGVEEKIVLRLRAIRPEGPSPGPVPLAAAWLPGIGAGDVLAIDRLPRSAALAEIGGELEDRRIRSLRSGLSRVHWLDPRRPSPQERWQADFPPQSIKVRGIENFATLVDRLGREGLRLGS